MAITMPILQDYFEKTCGKWLAPSEKSTNFRSVIFSFSSLAPQPRYHYLEIPRLLSKLLC